MPSRYEIREFRDALVITSFESRPVLNAALNAVVVGSASALFTRGFLNPIQTVIVSALCSALGMTASLRSSKAKLRITNNEFQMRGSYGPDARTFRDINSAEILGFTYLKYSEEGVEFPDYPGGLYALVGSRYVCLLPYVGPEDVPEITQKIRLKFSHLFWLTVH